MNVSPDLTSEQQQALAMVRPLMWADERTRNSIEQDYELSIEPATFYLGIPSVEEIRKSYEYAEDGSSLPVHGLDLFCLDREIALLQRLQSAAPKDLDNLCADTGFRWDNGQFSHSDALNLHLFLESMNIRRVIEVGSGWSSRIISSVLRTQHGSLTCIDPEPRAEIQHLDVNFIQKRIQDVEPSAIIQNLKAGDLLLIDSSHTLKAGSDCLYLYTRIVPFLNKGVYVHIHDLYLPYPRPIDHLLTRRSFWHEDYAVLLLMIGGVISPILSNYFLAMSPEALPVMVQPPHGLNKGGASIYFVKR